MIECRKFDANTGSGRGRMFATGSSRGSIFLFLYTPKSLSRAPTRVRAFGGAGRRLRASRSRRRRAKGGAAAAMPVIPCSSAATARGSLRPATTVRDQAPRQHFSLGFLCKPSFNFAEKSHASRDRRPRSAGRTAREGQPHPCPVFYGTLRFNSARVQEDFVRVFVA